MNVIATLSKHWQTHRHAPPPPARRPLLPPTQDNWLSFTVPAVDAWFGTSPPPHTVPRKTMMPNGRMHERFQQ